MEQERPFGFEIRREERSWTGEEARLKYQPHVTVPEKMELIEGKLFWNDEQRITMLGWMLEHLGADAAVRLGEPEVWKEAVQEMLRQREPGRQRPGNPSQQRSTPASDG